MGKGKLDAGKMQVYRTIVRVESGESHLHGAEARRPLKLSKTQENQVVKAMENKNGSSRPTRDHMPLSTDEYINITFLCYRLVLFKYTKLFIFIKHVFDGKKGVYYAR